MAATQEQQQTLDIADFYPAEWAATEGEGLLTYRSPNYKSTNLIHPNGTKTLLHPLRADSYGMILPHKYADEMLEHEKPLTCETASTTSRCGLTELHATIQRYAETGTIYLKDSATEDFESLMGRFSSSPYCARPEYAARLNAVFEDYKNDREEKLKKTAQSLGALIGNKELYIVYKEMNPAGDPPVEKLPLFAGRLVTLMHVRDDSRMRISAVIEGTNGKKGLASPDMYPLAGISAPAANQPVAR